MGPEKTTPPAIVNPLPACPPADDTGGMSTHDDRRDRENDHVSEDPDLPLGEDPIVGANPDLPAGEDPVDDEHPPLDTDVGSSPSDDEPPRG